MQITVETPRTEEQLRRIWGFKPTKPTEQETDKAENEDNTRPHYSNVWTSEDSLYVEQGMLYD